MAQFAWEARTRTGETKTGVMTADSMEAVSQKLRSQALQVSSIKKKAAQISFNIKLPQFGSGVTSKDLVLFSRQFATMIDAGLPLVQCLDILGNQNPNPQFKKVILDIKSTVETGTTFADALRKHPKVFDVLFCSLVAAGEAGGILDTILNKLTGYIEKNIALVKQIKSALTYPLSILSISFGVVAVMMLFVIPTFQKMFADMGATLPELTQGVIDVSKWFQANWYLLFGGIFATIFGFIKWKSTKRGREIFDKYVLKMPLIGEILRRVAVARFTSTMATMLSSGVPILDSLDIVAKAAGNTTIEKGIQHVRTKISEGKTMAQPLMETGVFPSMVVQMIAVGESTGALDKMLEKIASYYEEEVEEAVDKMTSMIEPVMMVFLGGVLGTILISMYLPIFTMAGSIK